jgi:hypothetical protein
MKIASIVAVAIVVAAAFYFSRTGHPPCADNILTSDISQCDFDLRENGK